MTSELLPIDEWRVARSMRSDPAGRPPAGRADVLLIGLSIDAHLGALARGILGRGRSVTCVHIDSDFGGGINTSYSPDETTCVSSVALTRCLDPCGTLLHHGRMEVHRADPFDPASKSHAFLRREAAMALDGWLGGVETRHWVNPPAATRSSASRVGQLRAAARAGLATPATLVTGDRRAARDFVAAFQEVVAKPLGSAVVWVGTEAAGVAHTGPIDAGAVSNGSPGFGRPVLLQERVGRVCEYRVVVMRDQAFSFRIRVPDGPADWRRALSTGDAEVTPTRLDDDLTGRVVRTVQSLGLEFAAVDLIEDDDGRITFLEANPDGSFLWIERMTGVSLVDRLVDMLMESVG